MTAARQRLRLLNAPQHPGLWRVGDWLMHPDGPRARRQAKLDALVEITAIKSTNRHGSRYRVDWYDHALNKAGHEFVTGVNAWRTIYRPH